LRIKNPVDVNLSKLKILGFVYSQGISDKQQMPCSWASCQSDHLQLEFSIKLLYLRRDQTGQNSKVVVKYVLKRQAFRRGRTVEVFGAVLQGEDLFNVTDLGLSTAHVEQYTHDVSHHFV